MRRGAGNEVRKSEDSKLGGSLAVNRLIVMLNAGESAEEGGWSVSHRAHSGE